MIDKKLNDNELEEVNGGVIPIIFASDKKTSDAGEGLVGVNRISICRECGNELKLPASGHGTHKCPICGADNRY